MRNGLPGHDALPVGERPGAPAPAQAGRAAGPLAKGRRHAPRRRLDYVLAGLATLVAAWGLWTGARHLQADLLSLEARQNIERWQAGKGSWQLTEWLQARRNLEAALAFTPDNASLHESLALLHMLAGRQVWAIEAARRPLYAEARAALQRALVLRPTQGLSWARLAHSEYALAPCVPAQWAAWRQALYHAPHEPGVQIMLAELGLACDAAEPPDVRAWLVARHAQPGRLRQHIEQAALRYGVERYQSARRKPPAGR